MPSIHELNLDGPKNVMGYPEVPFKLPPHEVRPWTGSSPVSIQPQAERQKPKLRPHRKK